jgi:hypothetical protein
VDRHVATLARLGGVERLRRGEMLAGVLQVLFALRDLVDSPQDR